VDVALEQLDLPAAVTQHEVVGQRLVVGQEVLLDDLGLVPQAEHEIGGAEAGVVVHDVPDDRLVANRDHRLRDARGGLAHP
jgi:hypothetical protein